MTDNQTLQTDTCPNCQHQQHAPGVECEGLVNHNGDRHWHRCLCLKRAGADSSCHPLMTCQGGSLGYSDIWHLQRGHTLQGADGPVTPDVLTVVPVSSPAPDQTAEPVCLCGHPMRQHHEDVCLTECGCNDGREPEVPADLPDRLEAALTARFTESGNPFARMRIAFQGPDGWPASKEVGPHDVALVLRELLAAAPAVPPPADRAAVLLEARDVARAEAERLEMSNHDARAARGARSVAYLLRRLAAEAQPELEADPQPELEADPQPVSEEFLQHLATAKVREDDGAEAPQPEEEAELVCVDECGFCDACGMEPFGTPAEGWREAARFLRRTPRDSTDFSGALRGARLIEDELRRRAEASQPDTAAPAAAGPGRAADTHDDEEGGRG